MSFHLRNTCSPRQRTFPLYTIEKTFDAVRAPPVASISPKSIPRWPKRLVRAVEYHSCCRQPLTALNLQKNRGGGGGGGGGNAHATATATAPPDDFGEEPPAAPAEGLGAATTQEDTTGKKKKGKGKKGKANKPQDDEEERRLQEEAEYLEQLEADAEQTPAETPADEISQPRFPEPQIPPATGAFGMPSSYTQPEAGGGEDDWGFGPTDNEHQHETHHEPPKSPARSPYRAPQGLTSQWTGEPFVPLDSQAPLQASPKPSPSRAAAQLPPSRFDFSQPTHPASSFENNWFDPPPQSPSKAMPPLPHTAAPGHPSPRRSAIQIPLESHTRPTGSGPRSAPVPIEGLATKAEALVHQYAPDPDKYQERIIQVRAPERAKPEDSEFLRRVGGNVKPDVVFLRRHFHGEGKLSESQAIWILEKAAGIFQSEQNVLDLEAPITSTSPSSFPVILPY